MENPITSDTANPTPVVAPVVAPEPEMNQNQALQVLIQAATFAQSKGVYSFDDSTVIGKAIKMFAPPANAPAK